MTSEEDPQASCTIFMVFSCQQTNLSHHPPPPPPTDRPTISLQPQIGMTAVGFESTQLAWTTRANCPGTESTPHHHIFDINMHPMANIALKTVGPPFAQGVPPEARHQASRQKCVQLHRSGATQSGDRHLQTCLLKRSGGASNLSKTDMKPTQRSI